MLETHILTHIYY